MDPGRPLASYGEHRRRMTSSSSADRPLRVLASPRGPTERAPTASTSPKLRGDTSPPFVYSPVIDKERSHKSQYSPSGRYKGEAPAPLDLTARRLARPSQTDVAVGSSHTGSEGHTYASKGLGLGLPFSATVSSGLDSYAVSKAKERAASISVATPARNARKSPHTGSSSASGPSAPSSPEIDRDRSKLIGLGELATPRWTAAIHEMRWGNHALPELRSDWESDVLSGYSNQIPTTSPNAQSLDELPWDRPIHRRQPSTGTSRGPQLDSVLEGTPQSSNASAIDHLLGMLSSKTSSADPLVESPYSIGSFSKLDPQVSPIASTSVPPDLSPRDDKRKSMAAARRVGDGTPRAEPSPSRRRTASNESHHSRRRSSMQAGAARRSNSPPPVAHPDSPPPPLPSSASFQHRKSGAARHSGPSSPPDLPPSALSAGLVRHAHAQGHDSVHPETDEATAGALRKLDGLTHPHSPRIADRAPQESSTHTAGAVSSTRRSLGASNASSRRTSQALGRPSSSEALSNRRTSSSSTGTPRDSSSLTTVSQANSSMRAVRRPSGASDLSYGQGPTSVSSSGEEAVSRGNESPIADDSIPPVPPLPKDWEFYKSPNELLTPRQMRADDSSSSLEAGPSSVNATPSAPTGKAIPRGKKWSISQAFSLGKTPALSLKGSSSFNDLVFPGDLPPIDNQISATRQYASERNIAEIASVRRPRKSEIRSRPSTSSSSSGLEKATPAGQLETASALEGSSSYSKSSLSTSRRTPSGIPFFSRKSSSASFDRDEEPPAPVATEEAADEKEKSGRKSILGLSYFGRRKSGASVVSAVARRTPENPSNKPYADTHEAMPVPMLRTTSDDPNQGAPKTNFMGRKRGKTLSGSEESPVRSFPPPLPSAQIYALPQAAIQSAETDTASTSSVRAAPQWEGSRRMSASPGRLPRLEQVNSAKSPLPTIAGSPSVALKRTEEPPKAATPTRIPRAVLHGSTSPAQLSEFAAQIDRLSPSSYHGPRRRATAASSSSQPSTSPETPLSATVQTNLRDVDREGGDSSAGSLAIGQGRNSFGYAQTTPRVAEHSALPRSTRRTSLLSTSRSSTDVVEKGMQADAPATKPIRHSMAGLRTPGKANTRATSNATIPATAPAARRNYLLKDGVGGSEAKVATRRASMQPVADVASTPRSAMSSISNKLTSPLRQAKGSTQPRLAAPDYDSSRSTPSTSRTTPVSDEEIKADEEMAGYARRQQAKKLAAGASREELQRMFEFPGPAEPLSGLTALEARALYSRSLCEYEKEEIMDFDRVWFFGQNSPKKMATRSVSASNFGYDDERGDYIVIDGDHIRFRYEITGMLGKGSFGQVAQCRDHATGDMMAIKIIRNKKRFHHQALIEIKVLENLRKWDPDEKHHVIKMTEHFSFRGHLCIVTELLSLNLYELIKANSFAGFSTILIRRFTNQILQALVLLRHHRVVHCDLKPENVLLRHPTKSGVQVIDFGSSCFEHEKVYTYIQSRFYRSPEVILGMNYHMAIDMWSLGCILAELYTGVPIFPGENEQEQLACIMECLGVPDKYLVDRSSRRKLFFDSTGQPRPVVNSKGKRRRPGSKTLAQVLKCDDELFVDFIAKCLIYDPDRRLKAQAALRHPFCRRDLRAAIPSSTAMPTSSRAPRLSLNNGVTLASPSSASTPKKKTPVTAEATTPSSSSLYSLSGPSTAPVQRTRQARSAMVVPQSLQRPVVQT